MRFLSRRRRPNPRLQRTPLRAPLSRKPLGGVRLRGGVVLIAAVGGLLAACASQQSPVPRDSPVWVDPAKVSFSQNRGTSCQDLVVIKGAKTDFEGTGAELIWLARTYPGYRQLSSGLGDCPGHAVDVVEIETPDNQRLKIMFDISATFGKM